MSSHSLFSLAGLFGEMAAHADHLQRHVLAEACQIIHAEARRVIGTYDYGWPQLAPATQADRVSKGFPANEPLLRTGALRDSIEWDVNSAGERTPHGYVGSNSQIAVWQFLGTPSIPPRDPILGAAIATHAQVEHHIGLIFHSWLTGDQTIRRQLY